MAMDLLWGHRSTFVPMAVHLTDFKDQPYGSDCDDSDSSYFVYGMDLKMQISTIYTVGHLESVCSWT